MQAGQRLGRGTLRQGCCLVVLSPLPDTGRLVWESGKELGVCQCDGDKNGRQAGAHSLLKPSSLLSALPLVDTNGKPAGKGRCIWRASGLASNRRAEKGGAEQKATA